MTGGEARQDTRAGSAPPSAPADDERPVRSTMAAIFSLEDDLTVVAGLNERLATLNGAPDADPGESRCVLSAAPRSTALTRWKKALTNESATR
ncbi:hypothetical protein GCM10022285_26570 [Streptomyces tunisiensis]|uniref:Uncharacterized protein n=1 Tax=Streptomyces tunisiensis TaxID=948699 RepID=A0ABP7YCP7_9ACTN